MKTTPNGSVVSQRLVIRPAPTRHQPPGTITGDPSPRFRRCWRWRSPRCPRRWQLPFHGGSLRPGVGRSVHTSGCRGGPLPPETGALALSSQCHHLANGLFLTCRFYNNRAISGQQKARTHGDRAGWETQKKLDIYRYRGEAAATCATTSPARFG